MYPNENENKNKIKEKIIISCHRGKNVVLRLILSLNVIAVLRYVLVEIPQNSFWLKKRRSEEHNENGPERQTIWTKFVEINFNYFSLLCCIFALNTLWNRHSSFMDCSHYGMYEVEAKKKMPDQNDRIIECNRCHIILMSHL